MTQEEKVDLLNILAAPDVKSKIAARLKAIEYVQNIKPVANKRTGAQHRALFLWYGQIENICENMGITWDRLIRHTHQIKVTKENLHEAGKQLQKALWGKYTTKELEKNQIDTLVTHFTDWLSKEGIEVPPFPSDESKLAGYKTEAGKSVVEYPEYEEPTI